jgi:hypothetical protein
VDPEEIDLMDAIATIGVASIFLAAGIAVFAAWFCYAKFTPAALHCGEFADRAAAITEAAGGNPKFRIGHFPDVNVGAAKPVVCRVPMASA